MLQTSNEENKMKNLTKNQKAKLDKEAQVYKCLVCDKEKVRWNGQAWECGNCRFLYSGMLTEGLVK